jgi:hypothetical protein
VGYTGAQRAATARNRRSELVAARIGYVALGWMRSLVHDPERIELRSIESVADLAAPRSD